MKKVEAVVREERLPVVLAALSELGRGAFQEMAQADLAIAQARGYAGGY